MERYEFEVESIHALEYRTTFFTIFEQERAKGNLQFRRVIKEMAPPSGFVRDFIMVSAAVLTSIKVLYDFYKEIKSKRGRVYITAYGERFDLEAYNIDELKVKISQKRKRKG